MAPSSLRLQLLRRLLPAILGLLLAGAATAYGVAWRSATKAYDRALFDAVLAIAEQLHVVDGKPQLQLTNQARNVLLIDKFDHIYYVVRGPDGQILDGDAALPLPDEETPPASADEPRYYYNGLIHGEAVRLAALHRDLAGHRFTVVVGETKVKRAALIQEILLGMLLPEVLLALASISVIWFGIRAGLRPLDTLRGELAGRSPTDLGPLGTAVPDELQPVVGEVNALMGRLALALTSQRNFVSDAAHQLRTPIAALQAQVEAAIGEAGAATRADLAGIQRATQRLSHLVSQLLALARAEPTAAQQLDELDLAALAGEAAGRWLPQAIARGIDLGFELAPAQIRGNGLLIEELLGNLVDNALRHTPSGGSITIACGKNGSRAWLTVEDSGPGIEPAEREQVFERFHRAPGAVGDGCGLGLAIVRAIARQHGGTVSAAASARLGGALLRVELPT